MSPATVVDHIEPHKGDEMLFWMRSSNWQSLCRLCHELKTKYEQGTTKHAKVSGRVVICGESGGGKTFWLQANSDEDDLTWDMDAVASELGMKSTYPRPEHEYRQLRVIRARLLSRLYFGMEPAKVIVSHVGQAKRIAKGIGADVVQIQARCPVWLNV